MQQNYHHGANRDKVKRGSYVNNSVWNHYCTYSTQTKVAEDK